MMFFLPVAGAGTVSPVVAKLAVETAPDPARRTWARRSARCMPGGWSGRSSGTFLTGFLLIDVFGTKGRDHPDPGHGPRGHRDGAWGEWWHAAWAGIPARAVRDRVRTRRVPGEAENADPPEGPDVFRQPRRNLGASARQARRSPTPRTNAIAPTSKRATTTTSRSTNQALEDDGQKRTLVLDNLIHGYFILKDHPERLDYALRAHLRARHTSRDAGEGQGEGA